MKLPTVECVNCGRTGYYNPSFDHHPWLDKFVCSRGCDPEDIKRYQAQRIIEERKRKEEASQLVSDGAGI